MTENEAPRPEPRRLQPTGSRVTVEFSQNSGLSYAPEWQRSSPAKRAEGMSEFYKLNIADWNIGTDGLSLELEAAYLRIVNAINLYDQPIRDNLRVLAGMWRCNERKAKRIRQCLIDAEKIWTEDGFILNERAVNDVSTRRALRVERASAGRRGGIESGKVRRKILKNKESREALGLTRIEENRIEEKTPPKPPKGGSDIEQEEFDEWYGHYPRKVAKGAARRAFRKARKLAEQADLLSAAKSYAASTAGKDKEFIAHPATWLNGERWLDSDKVNDAPGPVSVERRVQVAKDWLARHDDIPTWMDSRETAEALVKEGYDYEKLRLAGFSIPPRGNVVDIGEAVAEIAAAKTFGRNQI